MTIVADNIIKINGWKKDWILNTLSLRQSYNDHHVFEASVLVPESSPTFSVSDLAELLGQDAQLTIQIEGSGASCKFNGFVDEVIPVWTSRACMLKITGYSKTIFMDCGPVFRTFYQKSIGEIVQKIMNSYRGEIAAPILNRADEQADFSVQTQETDYLYLCRLADTYGQVFYFDGQQLHFGDLGKKEAAGTIELTYGKNLKQASVSMNIAPLKFELGAYKIETNTTVSYSPENDCSNNHPLAAQTIKKSAVYPAPKMHLPNITSDIKDLKRKSNQLLAKQAHGLVHFKGTSDLPSLKIGSRISIKDTKEMIGQGEFIITEINHRVAGDRSYSNTFTAIPAGYPFPIRMHNSNHPLCGPVMAIVKDHDDPDKLGRVRVEFIGDEEKTRSPWLRVLTPYSGFGGMYFLPEPEDCVVVQAEDFNIEKSPFVQGAFFHGKANAAQWHDPKNKKKGFATEKVSFKIDDRTGKLSIEADDIEIKARMALKTESKTTEFTSDQSMKIESGQNLALKATRIDIN